MSGTYAQTPPLLYCGGNIQVPVSAPAVFSDFAAGEAVVGGQKEYAHIDQQRDDGKGQGLVGEGRRSCRDGSQVRIGEGQVAAPVYAEL